MRPGIEMLGCNSGWSSHPGLYEWPTPWVCVGWGWGSGLQDRKSIESQDIDDETVNLFIYNC